MAEFRSSDNAGRCPLIFRVATSCTSQAAAYSGEMRKVGEDVTYILGYIPGPFEVVRRVRPGFSCWRAGGRSPWLQYLPTRQ
jgi:hypothetical protein